MNCSWQYSDDLTIRKSRKVNIWSLIIYQGFDSFSSAVYKCFIIYTIYSIILGMFSGSAVSWSILMIMEHLGA